jgi:hypothetical protein
MRIGIPTPTGALRDAAEAAGYPAMMSANAFRRGGRFVVPSTWRPYPNLALDSAGFVAMARYGGYPWSPDAYLELVEQVQPRWYAAMDYCCEPEVSPGKASTTERVWRTVGALIGLRARARRHGMAMPMPVLQGWRPGDYLLSARLTGAAVGDWPALVGVGSVCRRQWSGPDGLSAVLSALTIALPVGVRLHLFGVKSSAAVAAVATFGDRIASTDSMAWDSAARRECALANKASGARPGDAGWLSCSMDLRIRHMHAWARRQSGALSGRQPQQLLFGGS